MEEQTGFFSRSVHVSSVCWYS